MAEEHLISLQPGTVIAGRYEVVKCLGAGSMGLVYACRHRELSGHLVAVKVLFPEVAQDKIAAARFRNEIFASYGVSHPNVVRAYEYLRDGDLVAYTMEFVGGGDLASRLSKRSDRLPIDEIVDMLFQMCSGVQAIHDAGIVHRDLKPENILLTKDGMVKIADFGIARTGHGPKLTEHGGVVGTIDYVSPEYLLNSHVDWRSDIYALGILAYEMIAGDSPFRGDSVYATMTKRLKSDPPALASHRSECPLELERIVFRAMARDPEARYQSAAEMARDLSALLPERRAGASGSIQRPSAARFEQPEQAANVGSQVLRQILNSPAPGSSAGAQAPDREEIEDVDIEPRFDHDSDTLHEPMEMERVLARGDIVSGGWNTPAIPTEVSVGRGGIDQNRMRRLSQLAENANEPSWIDFALLVGAVVFGVGIAVLLLRLISAQPSLGSGTQPPSAQVGGISSE